MNVNQVSRSLEIYQSTIPSKPVSQIRKPVAKGNDTMILSEAARDFKTVLDALKNVPDVREDRVTALKDKISSDNYKVDAGEISNRIIRSYMEFGV